MQQTKTIYIAAIMMFLVFMEFCLMAQTIPLVDAGPDIKIIHGGKAYFKATATGSNLSYKWMPSPGIENDQVLNAVAAVPDITYTLTVTSGNGYIVEDKVHVQEVPLFIPNVFTPNGDGINDLFIVQGLDSYPGVSVKIFNRSNALVYESIGYADPWNGRYFNTGAHLDVDGYLCIIDIPGMGVYNKVINLLR